MTTIKSIFTGCLALLALTPALTAGTLTPVTTLPSHALKFTSAHAKSVEDGMLVAGTVRRSLGRPAPRQSRIHASVVDAAGTTLHAVKTDTLPKPIRVGRHVSGKARFAVKLPVTVPAGGKILVSHHSS